MLFLFLTCIVGTIVGRNIGWWFSKAILYSGPLAVVIPFLIVWGCGTGIVLNLAIRWLHPSLLPRIIGYGAGAYVSIPAYGLIQESTIPPSALGRHRLVNNFPLVMFVLTVVTLAFLGSRLMN
jgi:hypothetical protein